MTIKKYSSLLILCISGLLLQQAMAETINYPRAKFNYQMFCQGCHTPDGTGAKDIPKIKNHIGYFLTTNEGREYLVRVPGSANAALDDKQLAEVLNWMIIEFGGESIQTDMRMYTASEVGILRKDPLFEVANYRTELMSKLPINQ